MLPGVVKVTTGVQMVFGVVSERSADEGWVQLGTTVPEIEVVNWWAGQVPPVMVWSPVFVPETFAAAETVRLPDILMARLALFTTKLSARTAVAAVSAFWRLRLKPEVALLRR